MNLDSEIRNGFSISHETKKIWDIQLKLVQKLLQVCNKHDLKVWADSGTLIGAVRDKGFIPWDDDIDMIMMRDDYNKLISFADEFEKPYFLQCAYTDKGYARGHIQLRYQGTTAILPADINKRFDQSIFIDVFVYDAVPKDYHKRTLYARNVEFLRSLAWGALYPPYPTRHWKKFLANWFAFALKPVCNFYSIFEKYCSKYPIEDESRLFLSSLSTHNIEKFAISPTWYKETIWVSFEDITIPIPKEYDKVLKAQYGDYMTPVKAPSLHGCVIFDTERPYTEVLKDIKSGKIDIPQIRNL